MFTVHLYREMRLTFHGIVSDSPCEAAELVRTFPTGDASEIEDCNGQDFGALVDLVGDDDFEQSVLIDFEKVNELSATPEIIEAVRIDRSQ